MDSLRDGYDDVDDDDDDGFDKWWFDVEIRWPTIVMDFGGEDIKMSFVFKRNQIQNSFKRRRYLIFWLFKE